MRYVAPIIITLGYSPDGDLLWTQIYVGPDYESQSDYPHEIAVDEAANVFVAAHSWGDNSNDFTTIRYSQEVLFGDGFETGDTSDWSATVP